MATERVTLVDSDRSPSFFPDFAAKTHRLLWTSLLLPSDSSYPCIYARNTLLSRIPGDQCSSRLSEKVSGHVPVKDQPAKFPVSRGSSSVSKETPSSLGRGGIAFNRFLRLPAFFFRFNNGLLFPAV